MNEQNDDILNGEETEQAKKKKKSGSGEAGGIRLPPKKVAEVAKDFEYLDANKIAARVAEFFSDLPARASANLQVNWANLKNQGFAIVSQLIQYGQGLAALVHNLTAENKLILREKYNLVLSGPSG